jgi:hypothetical protein
MSQVLTLELSDQDYTLLKHQAEISGVTITEWAIVSLTERKPTDKAKLRTEAEKDLARQRFRRHAGIISLGAKGADNESIDADLARSYGDELGETN